MATREMGRYRRKAKRAALAARFLDAVPVPGLASESVLSWRELLARCGRGQTLLGEDRRIVLASLLEACEEAKAAGDANEYRWLDAQVCRQRASLEDVRWK